MSTPSDDASPPSPPDADALGDPIDVLWVGDDADSPDAVESRLRSADGVDVRSRPPSSGALAALDEVDCVVAADATLADGRDLLTAVRERAPRVPVLLVAADPADDRRAAVREDDWSEHAAGTDPEGVVDRVRRLVGHERDAALAGRALAALELVPDGTAIASPDGTVAFADPAFARQFGVAPGDLSGVDWRELFTEAEIDRLESDALPSLGDGWHWVGACEGRRGDGGTFTTRTRIAELEDGSLVFIVQCGTGSTRN
ncbi:PAS domain-containing protein [Halomicrobium salinisoli]|uniref:PAS domain-containing protein n=1 Tax=Halomicrobium salinisoli TaxID=2878391 RepID=UPI001CEFE8D3|nr:PAS domain-containing protein [Halomicrobium salinisoli]